MKRCLYLGTLIYVLFLIFGPRDENSDFGQDIDDPTPINKPIKDSSIFIPKDSTPYHGHWVDVN